MTDAVLLPSPTVIAVTSPASTKLFRAFKVDADGAPKCGTAGSMLGVRPIDVEKALDAENKVHPGLGGLSVTPDDPKRMKPFLRPPSLGGHGTRPIFMIASTALGAALSYRPDPTHPRDHGFVEPASVMKLEAYQVRLAATRSDWKEVSP